MEPAASRRGSLLKSAAVSRRPSMLSNPGQTFWESYSDARRKAPKSECVHRVGPAAIEDVGYSDRTADIGTLDSDVEDEGKKDAETGSLKPKPRSKKAAGSRALLIYFSKLAKKGSTETIDYRFLDSLFKSGAQVNVCDKHGQTALFEVTRNWNVDVARYFVHYGAALNHKDNLGRTPLHLASAVNHFEMVEFLIKNGGDINAKTLGEVQSPIHFAAKYNAVNSLKVIIENKAYINARDYKQRTPLFIAAEMAQEDSARYLVEYGAPVGVFDDTGMSAIGVMIDKMPNVALDALDQFRVVDPAFRKEYYYLNYLEYDPLKWKHENVMLDEFGVALVHDKKEKKKRKRAQKLACPTTALHLAVEHEDVDIIMHTVIQKLIKEKWRIFGRYFAILALSIHLVYVSIWIWLAIFLPQHGKYYDNGIEWRLFLEAVGVLLTFYFIFKLTWESKIKFKECQNFRMWRRRQINRDLEYCHPRWEQEKIFLESELKTSRSSGGSLLSDPWNILEFFTIASVLVVIITRVIVVFKVDQNSDSVHRKSYTLCLILMCLHFMKSCRPFTTLGPFITMLGHVIRATGQFVFIVFEFYIPYTVGIWIMFGGEVHAKKMDEAGEDSVDWKLFNNLLFSMWQVMLNVDFNMDGLYAVNRQWAQILIGTYFACATVLCLNLYIALLSETFNKVYQNAKANASLLQANTILQMENVLGKKRRRKVVETIQEECGPLEQQQEVEDACCTEQEMWDKTTRTVLSRFTKLNDFLRAKFALQSPAKTSTGASLSNEKNREDQEAFQLYQLLLARDKELHQLLLDIYDMKCAVLTYLGEKHKIPPRPLYKQLPANTMRCPRPIAENRRQSQSVQRQPVHKDGVTSVMILDKRNEKVADTTRHINRKTTQGNVNTDLRQRKFVNPPNIMQTGFADPNVMQTGFTNPDITQRGFVSPNTMKRELAADMGHSTISTTLSDSWDDLPQISVNEDGYIDCFSTLGPSCSATNIADIEQDNIYHDSASLFSG